MKTMLFLFLNLIFFSFQLSAQSSAQNEDESRQDKLELILRLRDTRTIYDGKLISFFSDTDRVVREKVVLAYGNIQDTSIINLLVDRLTEDPDPQVRFAAAFAIGQTAGQLSKRSREILQHDLIWARLDKIKDDGESKTNPADRLIEEIGKFGTGVGLNDLILRFENVSPPAHQEALTMCIARFAIRAIITKEAVQYLLKFTKPLESTPWQVLYALQRIGNRPEIHSEIENIAQLYKHRNPIVRMYLATLLGKVKDEKICLEPLQKLADFDGDWRVRINALKALGNYDLRGKDDIVQTIRRLFFAGNTNIAVTALSAFGNTGLKKDSRSQAVQETFSALGKIAVNKDHEYLWQLQAEAATALAKLDGKSAFKILKLTGFPQPLLQAQLLVAFGLTGMPDAVWTLFQFVGSDVRVLYRAALEGLQELSKRNSNDSAIINQTYEASRKALSLNDVAIVTTATSILGDSLFLRKTSVELLLDALSRMQIPDDVEAMQEIAATLGKLKDTRAVEPLRSQLEQRDRSVAFAAASALKSITGQDYSPGIPKHFEPIFTDFDFKYLRSLPETIRVKMETIRGDVVMELYKGVAPFTVTSFLKLATQRGFYRGLSFHRVVPNFVVQGGDPRGDGWGGPGYSIRSEFSPLTYETGMLGMASSGKDTEGSQFFITQSPQPHLDGRYTIFGKVTWGMDVINKIQVDDHIFDIKVIQ